MPQWDVSKNIHNTYKDAVEEISTGMHIVHIKSSEMIVSEEKIQRRWRLRLFGKLQGIFRVLTQNNFPKSWGLEILY